tara:strand:- start:331 stop:852 length:522 start_codon:yes stop_codon:yes gene_type:complete
MCYFFPHCYLNNINSIINHPHNLKDTKINTLFILNICMKTLVAFILLWIGAETDYNTLIPHPAIKMVSQSSLNQMHFGDVVPDSKIHALYDPSTDTIYLKDTFNMFNVFDKGVLMHELMHYVHDLNDAVGTKFDCIAQSEAEIYPLQKKYLLEVHGVNWEYDSMYLKVISSCD